MRTVFVLVITCLYIASNNVTVVADSKVRPNIVFILIDDLRYDTFGFMGHPFVENRRNQHHDSVGFELSVLTLVDNLLIESTAACLISGSGSALAASSVVMICSLPEFPAATAAFL